jgi:CBS domain containing-hemolysin-like protein
MHGSVPLEDVESTLDLDEIPDDIRAGVRTLGGLVMSLLGRVAAVGDVAHWDGLRAEVIAVEGRRVEQVLVSKVTDQPTGAPPRSVSPGERPAPFS